jgi:hypothetical protein
MRCFIYSIDKQIHTTVSDFGFFLWLFDGPMFHVQSTMTCASMHIDVHIPWNMVLTICC